MPEPRASRDWHTRAIVRILKTKLTRFTRRRVNTPSTLALS